MAVNARFKGGYITRHYGDPAQGVHALQLEIAQRAYMNETTTVYDAARANRLRQTLSQMLDAYLAAAG
jgi:N-formylglutamate amidohydrolase